MAIKDQVILITGGARGIGLETAKALAAQGARLVLTDLDSPALEEAVAAIGDDACTGIVADVTDLAAMEGAVASAVERFGRLDVVLANAGIASYGSVMAIDPAAFQRTLDINITGVFNTARAAIPELEKTKGYLLVVSSLAAFAAAPGLAAYNASKAGVEHFANALRLEVSHLGIAVGCAHMSWIDTPLVQDAKKDLSTFQEMLTKLPPPLNKTTDVDACVKAFVKGVEKRSRHVYCPGWVRGAGLNRNVINSAVGNLPILRFVPDLLPRMDAEVRALGRSTSARNVANDQRKAAGEG
ncbi:NAD(P)-dependent dehydrogenase (short-subunit alcohol dehydrogenase family) [Nocardioides aromaticivorans]|uniref:NAD(P)-dependent dehydrogenase (Short-subunit alcohol dehydrogenase family) n=1 Tax=Nocardioides aromaticivorans TaxID=200618 RepID=A0A7Y9ZDI9_9ACTN|nr:SDR family oxidoreductase [Nocardioides aromaticivorans]NYI43447.1 NAD(P)-dependent dehydrogenase (short-subunit alcohol dehydrogenase family) [Nocardioides aromaticivorans]QSR27430.1 short-chain dehydrogenase [Nocardioides aromaticivorans]